MFPEIFRPFGFSAIYATFSQDSRPGILSVFICVSTLETFSATALNADFKRDLGRSARSRELAALCRAMKQQYA